MTLALSTLVALVTAAGAPPGWFVSGLDPHGYTVERLKAGTCGAHPTLAIASARPSSGNVTVMQVIEATRYLGKRVRFSATVRTDEVTGWAGLWMRVDGAEDHHSLAFDNMQNRPLTGTRPCARVSVVLDVAHAARQLALGVLLEGEGRLELTDVEIAPVDGSVPVTRLPGEANDPKSISGRVGDVLFSDTAIRVGESAAQETLLERKSPGRWGSLNGGSATLSADVVTVKLANPQASYWLFQPGWLDWLEGTFHVGSERDSTTVTGTWGVSSGPKLALKLRLSHDALDLEVDRTVHHFVRDPGFKVELGCVRFVLPDERGPSPVVCGDALEPGVATVQTTIALLLSCVQLSLEPTDHTLITPSGHAHVPVAIDPSR